MLCTPRRWLAGLLALSLGVGVGTGAQASGPPRPGLVHAWDFPRCILPATELARLIQDCMSRVMYPRGLAGGETPEVEVHAAALLCRRTRSGENGRALSGCVRSLLYERGGLGLRREEVTAEVATLACRHATSVPHAEQVEECMRRLLYTRGGLGSERTEMSPLGAAHLCQGVAAPAPLPFPFVTTCGPPAGDEAVRFAEECVKRLLYQRDGLGERRAEVTPEAAALACEGALSGAP